MIFPWFSGSASVSALLHLDLSAGQQLLTSDAFAVALVVHWNVRGWAPVGVGRVGMVGTCWRLFLGHLGQDKIASTCIKPSPISPYLGWLAVLWLGERT